MQLWLQEMIKQLAKVFSTKFVDKHLYDGFDWYPFREEEY